MLHARAAHAVVATGDAIYALAGTGAGSAPVLPVERFDGTRWIVETTLPGAGLNAPAAAVLDGRVYVIGGFDGVSNRPVARVMAYEIATRTWRDVAPLPAPRGGHAAVALDGRIHVLGGGNDRSTLASHDVYDPATDRWQAAAPLPRSEGSPAAVAWQGRLHAIGGRSGPSDFGDVYVYDPAHDRWTTGPSIPPRGTAGALVYCDRVHVIGGESQSRRVSLGDVLRLDPTGWTSLASLPTPRAFARAVLLRNAIYVVGGNPTPGPSHASEGSAIVERYRAACAR
jgi:N-acetylneuraminic acid mutarotase